MRVGFIRETGIKALLGSPTEIDHLAVYHGRKTIIGDGMSTVDIVNRSTEADPAVPRTELETVVRFAIRCLSE